MFNKETYIRRRSELKKLVGNGVIILFGNNEAPANYPANGYAPMRQDSSFLYYFGQHRDGLVGVIDIDNNEELLIGDDIDVEDIVWMGYTPSVADLAAEVGVSKTAPMKELGAMLSDKMVNYNNNPMLKWCLSNTGVKTSGTVESIQPVKIQQNRRIDGMVSLLNAYTIYVKYREDYLNLVG